MGRITYNIIRNERNTPVSADGQNDDERMWEAGRILVNLEHKHDEANYTQEQIIWAYAMDLLDYHIQEIV